MRHLITGRMREISAVLILTFVPITAACQSGTAVSEDDLARRARIAENLKFEIEQLREVEVVVTELDTGLYGLDTGTVMLAGQRAMRFVVSPDDKQLYLLAFDVIDASRTSDDLGALIEEQRKAELAAIQERSASLLEQSAGMPVRGNPAAPITIVEFSDFQCPYCSRAIPIVEQVLEKYEDEVRLVFMHLPLNNIHPWADAAAVASACAAQQGDDAFWELHDYFFANQQQVNVNNVLEKARVGLAETNIDMTDWSICSSDETSSAYREAREVVDANMQVASGYSISGTPGFFIDGRYLDGAKPLEDFDAVIAEVRRANLSPEELAALEENERRAVLAGIRARAERLVVESAGLPSRGSDDAPITIVEFSDFECPFCERATKTVEEVLEKYRDEVRLVYMHFPLQMHPWAEPAAVASTCAAKQSDIAFWMLHDYFFENQDEIEVGNVIDKARSALAASDIDLAAWSTCAEDEASEEYLLAKTLVEAHAATAREYGLTGTPGFFINGRLVDGAKQIEIFDEAIEAAREDLQTSEEQ